MCIRDSGWADVDVIVATPDSMAELGKLGKILGPKGLMPNPVSYTHLRAHETVLDLVCRLLLEKKKKSLQNDYLT